jgi:thiol-disulfide isomerase/thioredoxin
VAKSQRGIRTPSVSTPAGRRSTQPGRPGSPPRQPGAGPTRGGRRQPPPKQGWHPHPAMVAVVSAALVVVIVGAILGYKLAATGGSTKVTAAGAAPADVVAAVSHVPAADLSKVALGSPGSVFPPRPINGSQPPLTKNGKPEVLYMGAEYCPYCAATRWPLVVALSRFGTFSGLKATHSSSTDVYPNTATFSFYGSSYKSKYLSFVPVEMNKNKAVNGTYPTLQVPTKQQAGLLAKYDSPPYVPQADQDGIPFIDFANQYLLSGTLYNPQVLQGLSMGTIAGSLSLPTSAQGRAIDASANYLTATICEITHNRPASVCSSQVVAKAEAALGKSHAAGRSSKTKSTK